MYVQLTVVQFVHHTCIICTYISGCCPITATGITEILGIGSFVIQSVQSTLLFLDLKPTEA